jgi:metallophosphoesterase (TIGR00282 family)
MKILFIGDIYGKAGRMALHKYLPLIKEKYPVDLTILNAENTTHGRGLSIKNYAEIKNAGVDFITLGNHAFDNNEVCTLLKNKPDIIRPLNVKDVYDGDGSKVIKVNDIDVRITNVVGRVHVNMRGLTTLNPFDTVEDIVDFAKEKIHIIDMHAEATGEKYALALDFDGKVSAVLGTHTHIQTVDARIFENGTGFISDVGMTGPYNSIIGCKKEQVIYRNRTGLPARFDVAEGKAQFCAVVLDIDEETGRTTNIERIYILED